jgi:hypothetical protein
VHRRGAERFFAPPRRRFAYLTVGDPLGAATPGPALRFIPMCRNITTLRGLEPEATPEEIEAAARQYVRKVSGVHSTSDRTTEAFESAVRDVTLATSRLLRELPPRKQPPSTVPPSRRRISA